MQGIILKDLYEAFCLKKNLIAWISCIIVYGLIVILMPTRYAYILCVAVALPMLGISVLQYSIEQDEISKHDRIMLTYPLTKKEIILSKYLSGMVLQAMVFSFNFVLALLYSFGYKVIDFTEAMGIWTVGVIFSFIYMAINYMIFFWLGSKKGIVIYFIFVIVIAAVYIFSYFSIDITAILSINKILAMVVGFTISIVALVGSYYASIRIYTRRHIK